MPIFTITDPFSLALIIIEDKIKTAVASVQQVVKDVGQLETKQQPDIMPYTVLVSFQDWTFSEEGDGTQLGVGDVVLKVTGPAMVSVDAAMPVEDREKSLKFNAVAHLVHKALHGWPVVHAEVQDLFGRLTRTAYTEDTRRPGLGVAVMRYRLSMEDRSTATTQSKHAVTPAITLEFNDPGE